MKSKMMKVQKKLMEEGREDYQIIAFSVDPQKDSPDLLNEYISQFDVPNE